MRIPLVFSLAVACGLAACAPSRPATEQPAPHMTAADDSEGTPIRVGETAAGALTESDAVWGNHGRFDLYRFQANEEDRLLVELTSDEFDAYLVVGDRAGGIFNPTWEDDDGGSALDARVRFTAPRTGTYWILAQSYSESATGSYVLSVSVAPPPAAAVAIAPGASIDGRLEDTDRYDDIEQRYFDAYTLEAEAGRRYMVRMESIELDSYLMLGQGAGEAFDETTRNDDGGGGYDARIIFAPRASGVYTIRASAYGGGPAGAYTLSVTEMAPPAPLVVAPLTVGEPASGSLGLSDRIDGDGSFYDVYSFNGTEGDRVSITMRSDAFDSHLAVGEPAEGDDEFWGEYSDDDSGGGLDARVVATLWRTGEYHIHARSLFPDESGPYTITLEELPPPGPVSVTPIRVGTSVSGDLEPTDAILDDDSHHDIYTFRGTAGQRLRITLTSDDFDAYLSFGAWQDGAIEVTHTDDDSAGDLDSMIEVTLPSTGTYAIQANSYGGGELGAYSVTLEEM